MGSERLIRSGRSAPAADPYLSGRSAQPICIGAADPYRAVTAAAPYWAVSAHGRSVWAVGAVDLYWAVREVDPYWAVGLLGSTDMYTTILNLIGIPFEEGILRTEL